MNVRIKTTDYHITEEVQKYLDTRLSALEKLLGGDAALARCEVELGRDAGNQRHGEYVWFAEVNVQAPDGVRIRATNHAPNINAAIDDVKEEVERQLRREKQMHIKFLRKSGAALKRLMRWGGEEGDV